MSTNCPSIFQRTIDLNDLVRVILFALDSSAVRGPVNVVAPDPPTQAEFARKLGAALGRPSLLPVPALVLRLLLGELADVVLSSQRAVPLRCQLSRSYLSASLSR